MKKDTEYYNKEGRLYSQKRYPWRSIDFIHFFFKKRRDILMKMLGKIVDGKTDITLLEIGCADGVILRGIKNNFKNITRLVGVDISDAMIMEATKIDKSHEVEFYLKEADKHFGDFDIVIEIGVLNLTDVEKEFEFAKRHLKPGGYYICSFASNTSLLSILKIKKGNFYNHLSFDEYKKLIKKHFAVISSEPYGVFIPLIWKVPFLAMFLQPIFELIFRFVPNFFHERIYVLQKIDR